MSLPLVAVVGRPNVGKSTLVNRLAVTKEAIVHPEAGVTRDRNYLETDWNGRAFTIVDTGGISFEAEALLEREVSRQATLAIEEADVVVFVVDGDVGVMPEDEEIAKILRGADKPVLLVVNKIDSQREEMDVYQFYGLGLGDPYALSAVHGLGTGELLDAVASLIPEVEVLAEPGEIKVAIVGRPNVGKSSILNRLIGMERAIVSDVPGTTRDAIDTVYELAGKRYRFIDTAGLRRAPRVTEDVEYYGLVRSLRALDRADIAIIIIDATRGAAEQDQKIAGYAESRGCATIILVNKWDAIAGEVGDSVVDGVRDKLKFIGYSPVIRVSAVSGRGISKVMPALDDAYGEYEKRIRTAKLNGFVGQLKASGYAPSKGGKVLRIGYAAQVGTKPPSFAFFVNNPTLVTENYRRYLENRMREAFGFMACPISLRFKRK
ncbi:MAG: ribosome biogenesis GTPase Der [Actinobacteria bacterium]|nr:ribosome biogenesis GTPase Der [Chloroflexota bacterium]MCL5292275.1 ribosome biogenesis GTPase Der [Actinomycetota bacterium]